MQRRRFLQLCGSASALSVLPVARAHSTHSAANTGKGAARVVVVGGGYGGIAAAHLLTRQLPSAAVTLVTAAPEYRVPVYSNFSLVDAALPAAQRQSYDGIAAAGVNVVQATATTLDDNSVVLEDGTALPYDRAIVAPGIDFDYSLVEGVSADTDDAVPHGYRGNLESLRRQLMAMPEDGVFIIIPPPAPYRCSPAPYERAGLVAAYCDQHKPRAKVLILDQKESFAQQTLFSEYWNMHHRERIEWLSGEGGGIVEQIDAAQRIAYTEFGEEQGDVINYIPLQRAGGVAIAAGLADESGWCPVVPTTMQSTLRDNVHVIGDAALLPLAPKSGSCAVSQAAVAAAAVAQALGADVPLPDKIDSVCYSHITPTLSFVEHSSYALAADGLQRLRLQLTPQAGTDAQLQEIAKEGRDWHAQKMTDLFGEQS